MAGLPRSLDGVPVRVQVTGEIFALHHKCGHDKPTPGECPDPGDPTPTPVPEPTPTPVPEGGDEIPIGVSVGSEGLIDIDGTLYCTVGSLGPWLTNGTTTYALSNAHVLAHEGSIRADSLDRTLHPGRVDLSSGCGTASEINASEIGSLANYVALNFGGGTNLVDAAISTFTGGPTNRIAVSRAFDGSGPVFGPPDPSLDLLGLAVQKWGRTSGRTTGTIGGINVTLNVTYNTGTATFVHQLFINASKGKFLEGGDSGSGVFLDGGPNDRQVVGLAFAGGGRVGIANNIYDVLGAFPGTSVGVAP